MIQHVVLVNFRTGVPQEDRSRCVHELRTLQERVPGLRAWRVGLNRTVMDRAWDLGLTGEFDSVDAMLAYRAHPQHVEVQHLVDSLAAETIGVDFDPEA